MIWTEVGEATGGTMVSGNEDAEQSHIGRLAKERRVDLPLKW